MWLIRAARPRRLLDHLVGAGDERRRHFKAERLRGLEIDHQLELGRRLNWQLGRFLALEDAIGIGRREAKIIELVNSVGQQAADFSEDSARIDGRETIASWYARAREERADLLFERIAAIAKDATGDYVKKEDGTLVVDHENIQRSRLRVDTMKWMASKLAPRKYGDRVAHDAKSNVSMPAILIQVGGGEREDDAKLIEGN